MWWHLQSHSASKSHQIAFLVQECRAAQIQTPCFPSPLQFLYGGCVRIDHRILVDTSSLSHNESELPLLFLWSWPKPWNTYLWARTAVLKRSNPPSKSMISCRGASCSINQEVTLLTHGNLPRCLFTLMSLISSWSSTGEYLSTSPEHHLE